MCIGALFFKLKPRICCNFQRCIHTRHRQPQAFTLLRDLRVWNHRRDETRSRRTASRERRRLSFVSDETRICSRSLEKTKKKPPSTGLLVRPKIKKNHQKSKTREILQRFNLQPNLTTERKFTAWSDVGPWCSKYFGRNSLHLLSVKGLHGHSKTMSKTQQCRSPLTKTIKNINGQRL